MMLSSTSNNSGGGGGGAPAETQAFLLAVMNGDLTSVRQYASSIDINDAIDLRYGRNALHWSAIRMDAEMLRVLIEAHHAAATAAAGVGGARAVMSRLLRHSSELNANARDLDGNTPLMLCAVRPGTPFEIPYRLLSARADCRIADQEGRTALHLACISGAVEVVRALVFAAGALGDEITTHLRLGMTPEAERVLTEGGLEPLRSGGECDLQARDRSGMTPLLLAVGNCRTKEHADQYALTYQCYQRTGAHFHPLSLSVRLTVVYFLVLVSNAEPAARRLAFTLLPWHHRASSALVDVEAASPTRATPLHLACGAGLTSLVRCLLTGTKDVLLAKPIEPLLSPLRYRQFQSYLRAVVALYPKGHWISSAALRIKLNPAHLPSTINVPTPSTMSVSMLGDTSNPCSTSTSTSTAASTAISMAAQPPSNLLLDSSTATGTSSRSQSESSVVTQQQSQHAHESLSNRLRQSVGVPHSHSNPDVLASTKDSPDASESDLPESRTASSPSLPLATADDDATTTTAHAVPDDSTQPSDATTSEITIRITPSPPPAPSLPPSSTTNATTTTTTTVADDDDSDSSVNSSNANASNSRKGVAAPLPVLQRTASRIDELIKTMATVEAIVGLAIPTTVDPISAMQPIVSPSRQSMLFDSQSAHNGASATTASRSALAPRRARSSIPDDPPNSIQQTFYSRIQALVLRRANERDVQGRTPLYCATQRGHVATVRLLVNLGADVNIPDSSPNHGSYPLHLAVSRASIELLLLLLSASNVDTNCKNAAGNTPLVCMLEMPKTRGLVHPLLSSHKCKNATAQFPSDLLARSRVDTNMPSASGKLPLQLAASMNDVELVRILLHYGADMALLPPDTLHSLRPIIVQALLKNTGLKIDFSNVEPLDLVPTMYHGSWADLKSYTETLAQRAQKWPERRIVFVGEEGVGKTTLIKCFRSELGKVPCATNIATDGIEIHKNVRLALVSNSQSLDPIVYNIWDLGGQELYYLTHQFFLTSNCIYLVCFNVAKPEKHRVEYWLRQIKMLSEGNERTAIFIVGTHADDPRCSTAEINQTLTDMQQSFPRNVYKGLQGVCAVSCATGAGMTKLQRDIADLAQQKTFQPIVAQSWVQLYDRVCNRDDNRVHWSEFYRWAIECGVRPAEVPAATQFLCDIGVLVHFGKREPVDLESAATATSTAATTGTTTSTNTTTTSSAASQQVSSTPAPHSTMPSATLTPATASSSATPSVAPNSTSTSSRSQRHRSRSAIITTVSKQQKLDATWSLENLVVLKPQWLADAMRRLVTVSSRWVKDGVVLSNDIPHLFRDAAADEQHALLELCERFHVAIPMPTGDILVPWLLPAQPPVHVAECWPRVVPLDWIECGRVYDFNFLPLGFCSRLIARMYLARSIEFLAVWREGFLVRTCLSAAELAANHSASTTAAMAFVDFSSTTHVLNIRVRQYVHSSRPHDRAALLSSIVDAIETIVDCFYSVARGGMECFVPCSHCLANSLSARAAFPFRFTLNDVVSTFTSGKLFMYCNNSRLLSRRVRVDVLAPDVCFKNIKVIPSELIWYGPQIGKGGFGSVYSGSLQAPNAPSFSIPVALKQLSSFSSSSSCSSSSSSSSTALSGIGLDEFREFQQEVFIMSMLDHPNLVKLYGVALNPLAMVLELCTGNPTDLSRLLRARAADGSIRPIARADFPWRLRLMIALDIARGMRFLHTLSPPIVHRDLRSPNVFLMSLSIDAPVVAKVADFGLSRMLAPKLGGALPTWQWLAPEVIAGKSEYDHRSDVYSFGIVCWEIASRSAEVPFEEFRLHDEFRRVVNLGEVLLARDIRPTMPDESEQCPHEFAQLIQDCWQFHPADRPEFVDIVPRLEQLLGIQSTDLETSTTSAATPPTIVLPHQASSAALALAEFRAQLKHNVQVLRDNTKRPEPSQPLELEERHADGELFSLRFSFTVPSGRAAVRSLLVMASGHSSKSKLRESQIWVGLSNGFIAVYRTKDRELIASWLAHANSTVHSLLQVGSRVWSCGEDGCLCVWNSSTFALERTRWTSLFKRHSMRQMLLVSTEGHRPQVWVLCPSLYSVQIRDTKSSRVQYHINFTSDDDELPSLPLYIEQHNNLVLIATTKGGIFVLSAISRTFLGSIDVFFHGEQVSCIRSTGSRVWVGSDQGSILVFTITMEGDELQVYVLTEQPLGLHAPETVRCMLYRPPYMLTTSTTTVIWNEETHEAVQETTEHHRDSITALCSLPEPHNYFCTGSLDGTVGIWFFDTERYESRLLPTSELRSLVVIEPEDELQLDEAALFTPNDAANELGSSFTNDATEFLLGRDALEGFAGSPSSGTISDVPDEEW